jgi:hypothetical protein
MISNRESTQLDSPRRVRGEGDEKVRKLTVRLPIIVLVVALLSGLLLGAQSSTGTVNGQVSVVGGFLAGARVVIKSSGDANYTATSTTDENGTFSFTNVPVGTVEIKVYDAQSNLLKTVSATLASAGQVLNVAIQIP